MFQVQGSIEPEGRSLPSGPARASATRALHFQSLGVRFLSAWVLSATVVLGQAPAPAPPPAPDTSQRSRDMLQQATQDKNPDIRKAAVEALSLIGPTDPLYQVLTAMVQDEDVLVRVAAVTTLGGLKSRSTIPILKKALDDPIPEVSLAAATALYRLHDPDGLRFLLAVVSGESKASSSYLSQHERSVSRLLHTPTKLFTEAAINAAGFVPVPGLGMAVSSAQGIVTQPDSSPRAAALILIGSDHDPALESAVESDLSDKEWSVRAAAIHVVATHPYSALRNSLIVLLDDKKPAVRFRAAAAYIRLASKPQPSGRQKKPTP
jgi:HEAT repeat protein